MNALPVKTNHSLIAARMLHLWMGSVCIYAWNARKYVCNHVCMCVYVHSSRTHKCIRICKCAGICLIKRDRSVGALRAYLLAEPSFPFPGV